MTVAGDDVVYNWHPTILPAGPGREIFDRLEGGKVDVLVLPFADGVADLCVSDIWIGKVAAVDADGCSILDQRAVKIHPLTSCDESWSGVLGQG